MCVMWACGPPDCMAARRRLKIQAHMPHESNTSWGIRRHPTRNPTSMHHHQLRTQRAHHVRRKTAARQHGTITVVWDCLHQHPPLVYTRGLFMHGRFGPTCRAIYYGGSVTGDVLCPCVRCVLVCCHRRHIHPSDTNNITVCIKTPEDY